MKAAVPLKQADSICLDLKHSYSTAQPISQLWTAETCPRSLSQKREAEATILVLNGATLTVCAGATRLQRQVKSHLRRLGAQTMARFLVCMLVTELNVARWERCLMRYSRVLQMERANIQHVSHLRYQEREILSHKPSENSSSSLAGESGCH